MHVGRQGPRDALGVMGRWCAEGEPFVKQLSNDVPHPRTTLYGFLLLVQILPDETGVVIERYKGLARHDAGVEGASGAEYPHVLLGEYRKRLAQFVKMPLLTLPSSHTYRPNVAPLSTMFTVVNKATLK